MITKMMMKTMMLEFLGYDFLFCSPFPHYDNSGYAAR
jgi:hypothetical protein